LTCIYGPPETINKPTFWDSLTAIGENFVSGSLAACLVKKLAQTKVALKRWNSLHFGNIQAKIKSTQLKIDQV
jgi:hypothetical protein